MLVVLIDPLSQYEQLVTPCNFVCDNLIAHNEVTVSVIRLFTDFAFTMFN